jgi:DNA-binding transcriptional regulator LsrR (DeoR family)
MPRPSLRPPPDQETRDRIAYRIADLFLGPKRTTMDEIRRQVQREMAVEITRESAYRYLALARERGFIRFVPPLATKLSEELTTHYGKAAGEIVVVNNVTGQAGDQVAACGADEVYRLIHEIWESKPPSSRQYVNLGLGPGRATRDVARSLSERIRTEKATPPLRLIAISAGCPPNEPYNAPASFFTYFPRHETNGPQRIECVGLFGQTLVEQREMPQVTAEQPGVKEAYRLKNEIDIVVSSMGDPRHEHDLLRLFYLSAGLTIPERWVGNVQFRPYDLEGPIREEAHEKRALTLFELDDFHAMAEKAHKAVVLVARMCTADSCTQGLRTDALRPLLTSSALKMWNRLVMDVPHARALLADKRVAVAPEP